MHKNDNRHRLITTGGRRALAFLLSFVMVTSSLPMQAIAEAGSPASQDAAAQTTREPAKEQATEQEDANSGITNEGQVTSDVSSPETTEAQVNAPPEESSATENVGGEQANEEQQKRDVISAMQMENRFRTSFGVQLLSKDDSWENHAFSFTGLGEIYEQFMMDMAGAAEIPATRLFGRSPQGMNATGESDLRNYYDMIASLQERQLRPALEKLLPVMAVSCWGYIPEDLEFVFEPASTASPLERAELAEKLTSPVIAAFSAGLLTREEALEELRDRGSELGLFRKI